MPKIKYSFSNNFRNFIWPIDRSEFCQFFSSSLLMFSILMIQNIIRAIKDSVINTKISTEVIVFLKFWGVMPASLLFAVLYVYLVDRVKPEKVFYYVLISFISFFGLFGFIIFPMQDILHLDPDKVKGLILAYPHFKWFIYLFANWGFSLFYIITELWPTATFALLFWQFMNNITSVEQSKRFYPLFSLFGQTGLIFSGLFLSYLLPFLTQKIVKSYSYYKTEYIHMYIAMFVVVILGITALLIFRYMYHNFINSRAKNIKFGLSKNSKASLIENIRMIVSSPYIRLITILLFCYGISINLVEGPWKATASSIYSNTQDYSSFVGMYLMGTGFVTLFLVVICSILVRYAGWIFAALITPIMMLIFGTLFFSTIRFVNEVKLFAEYFLIYSSPIYLSVYIGALQNIFVKSSKYTLFDSTKEIAYVPLDDEIKTKGKAAADMIGIKFGKGLGAFLPMIIFTIFPNSNFIDISGYLMIFFIIICILWIYSTISLAVKYNELTK